MNYIMTIDELTSQTLLFSKSKYIIGFALLITVDG